MEDTNIRTAEPQREIVHRTLSGDIVELGISKQAPEIAENLRWVFRYMTERRLTLSDLSRLLNVDSSCVSRVFRGTYTGKENQILPPPSKMLERIAEIRRGELQKQRSRRDRVLTPTVQRIWDILNRAAGRKNDGSIIEDGKRLICFIFGNSHIGKTSAAKWYKDEFNPSNTIYVDLQGCTNEGDILREFAKALNIPQAQPKAALKLSIYGAITSDTFVIADEFHAITYAVQHRASVRLINTLKAIKDKTGCAMGIISTNVGRDELDNGVEKKLLEQLSRRGVLRLNLPSGLPVYDVRAVCEARGLHFPPAPIPPRDGNGANLDTWQALRKAASDGEELPVRILEDIALNHGMEWLFTNIEDAQNFARKRGETFTWRHFRIAHNVKIATQREENI